MVKKIDAIYENGVLHPVEKLDLRGKQRISISISLLGEETKSNFDRMMEFFGTISDEDAKMMTEAIEVTFERIDYDAWK